MRILFPVHIVNEWAERYRSGESVNAIAGDDYSPSTVRSNLKQVDIVFRSRFATKGFARLTPLISQIVNDYNNGIGLKSLRIKYRTTVPILRTLLQQGGIASFRTISEACRLLPLDETAFDEINEKSAYYIGLLMTDGCIHKAKWQSVITLVLQKRDRALVEDFRTFMKSGHKITYRPPPTSTKIVDGSNGKHAPVGTGSYGITFSSARIANRLAEFGVVPRKSLAAEVRHLEMNVDFWRGCVDGDGTVSFHRSPKAKRKFKRTNFPFICLCGSQQIVKQFETFVKSIVPECTGTIYYKRRIKDGIEKVFAVFRTTGSFAVTIANVLYGHATCGLARKMATASMFPQWQIDENERVRLQSETFQMNMECNVPECTRPQAVHGYCTMHNHRLIRRGNLERDRGDWSNLTRQQLIDLLNQFGFWAKVAKHLGINRCVLANVRTRLNVPATDGNDGCRRKTIRCN